MTQQQNPRSPVSSPQRRCALLRKFLLGLALGILVLCVLETVLWLFCVATGQDWTVNPLPASRPEEVLLPHGDQLRFFPQRHQSEDEEARLVVFSPKPTRQRVIVIGESFVYGLGLAEEEAWPARLEEHLDGDVEVLNFGRVGSFASLLVPVLEAGLTLEPDVIILAIGNNEHTMTTFYSGWAGRYPNAVYSLSEVLGRIRIYGLLHRLLIGSARVEETADRSRHEFDAPIDQDIYDIRRRPPGLDTFPDRVVRQEVTEALESEQRLKERVFRALLREMVEDIQGQGVRVVLTTLPVDLTKQPMLSGMYDGDEAVYRAIGKKFLKGHGFSEIEQLARKELSEYQLQRFAHFQHARGMCLLHQGQENEAVEALRLAMEWDLVPDITPGLNEIIRSVAREHECLLVDLARLVEETYLNNPSAFFREFDSLHVNAEGADVVATHVAAALNPASTGSWSFLRIEDDVR